MLETLHAERLDWWHNKHNLLLLDEVRDYLVMLAVVSQGDELVG